MACAEDYSMRWLFYDFVRQSFISCASDCSVFHTTLCSTLPSGEIFNNRKKSRLQQSGIGPSSRLLYMRDSIVSHPPYLLRPSFRFILVTIVFIVIITREPFVDHAVIVNIVRLKAASSPLRRLRTRYCPFGSG